MAFDHLSRSTRHSRTALIAASIASAFINTGIAEIEPTNIYSVQIESAPLLVRYILLVVIFWSAFSFAFSARVDWQNSERTSLERRYVQAWEEFHAMLTEHQSSFNTVQENQPTTFELFSYDFDQIPGNWENRDYLNRQAEKLKTSRDYILSKIPSREEYNNNRAPKEALWKFWIVDCGMPAVCAVTALVLHFFESVQDWAQAAVASLSP